MNTDPVNQFGLFPLPHGMKIRKKKIGVNPVSPLFPVPAGGENGNLTDQRPRFSICWEDQKLGVTVHVREGGNGRLIAEALCTDAGLLDKAWASVSLVGTGVDHMSCKPIPLNMPEQNGCSGSADLGSLADAVKELGTQIGVVIILLV